MEKMNQVSVTEFMELTKPQMYDKAVEMVEKYNRLVDICNDSSERISELVIERDNLSKGVQKLIGERDELIERHKVYTNALNNDIADKAAKIELLEKEIEGRKEGYVALKELMDTKYISIEEHNNICEDFKKKIVKLEKESEKWQDLAKMNRDTICNQYDVCEDFKKKIAELEEKVKHQRENLDGINKTLEIRTKENESLIKVRNNLNKEIEAHEHENKRLTEKIMELKKERDRHMSMVNDLRMELDCAKASKEKHEEAANEKLVEGLRENIGYWRNKYVAAQEEIENLKKECKNKSEIIRKAYVRYVDEACKSRKEIMNDCYKMLTKDDTGYIGFKQYTLGALEAQEGNEETAEEFLCDTIELIFYNKKAEEKRKEETKKELNEAFGVPCGSDSIE